MADSSGRIALPDLELVVFEAVAGTTSKADYSHPCRFCGGSALLLVTCASTVRFACSEWLYTGTCWVLEDKLQALLEASARLLVCELRDACADAVTERVTVENCCGMFDLAERYSLPKLSDAALKHATINFEEVASQAKLPQSWRPQKRSPCTQRFVQTAPASCLPTPRPLVAGGLRPGAGVQAREAAQSRPADQPGRRHGVRRPLAVALSAADAT